MSKIFMLDAEQVAELERSSRNEVVEWLYEAVRLNPGIPSEALVGAVNQWLGNPDREFEDGSYAEADVAGLGEMEFVPLGDDEDGDVINPADVDVNEASEDAEPFQEDAAVEVLAEDEDWSVEVLDLEDTVEFSAVDLEEATADAENTDDDTVEPVELAVEETVEESPEIDEDERILVPMDEDYVVEVAPNDTELALQEAADEVLQESISEAAQQRLNIRSILKDASALDRSSR